ncbi:uncharacterized protein NPIL_686831, partial [Nephila pilipes]
MVSCIVCGKGFYTNYNLKRHTLQVHEKKYSHQCPDCSKKFAQPSDLKRHKDSVHSAEKISTSAENSAAVLENSTTVPENSTTVPENSDDDLEKISLPPKESESAFQKVLFTDYDMLLFIENGVRGGISQCCNRYAIANNKYMPNFNPDDEIKYLMYLDANNLYGYAMSKYLPLKDFVWSDNNLTTQDILNLSDESDVGYILEVDLDYPPDLHDKHSDFPLAPENKPPPNCKEPRLLTTLEPKTKYVLHYSNLKLYLKLGLILKKIHHVLKFFQSPWLKNYIDYNTKLRTKAFLNDFQKDFYKLMNNSIFGKTMENVRRRVDIRLCSTEEQARKLIAKSNFNRRTIFSENLMAVHLKKTNIKFFKPIHVGMTILDLSKVLMYSFHYEYMKHRYDSKIKLMYTDTDSFIYEIKTDDFYSDMKDDLNLYDTSDYDKNNVYNLPLVNKKVIGKMKDENKGNIMTEY